MGSSATFTHRESMLSEWLTGAQILANGHYYASKRDTRWNDILGTAVITTTAIVGSTIFASLGSSTERGWQIVVGLISMSATVLAAVQKSLRFDERATQHREAGRVYQSLRQEIEVVLTRLQDGGSVGDEEIAAIKTRRDEIEKAVPTIPSAFYDRAKKEVRKSKERAKAVAHGAPEA